MREIDYKRAFVREARYRRWHIQCHEDSDELYIPDISFAVNGVDGWIEVKYQQRFPSTIGAVGHWTVGQEVWLRDRGRVGGGHCYLLLGTDDAQYLWRWSVLHQIRPLSIRDAPGLADYAIGNSNPIAMVDLLTAALRP